MRLAARGGHHTHPNPRVGAVLVRDGEVVGEGFHSRLGAAHAETMALSAAGERGRGATAYVTLEPCNHFGRTPPCTEALLAARVSGLVACHRDPDPRVAGQGLARLRAAGLAVEVGRLAEEAVALNLRYLVPRLLGRPQVTLKWAMSLDGKIATASGESRWISSPAGRRWAVALRDEHDAILVGSGTVLADDPRLNRRSAAAATETKGMITRVVLDRRLRLRPPLALLSVPGPLLIYTEALAASPRRDLEAAGAEVVVLPQVGPASVLADLHRRGLGSVLVEGGAEVLAVFAAAGCYDRVAVDLAPLLLGGRQAPGPLAGFGLGSLAAAPRLGQLTVARRGADLILTGARPECLRELSAKLVG